MEGRLGRRAGQQEAGRTQLLKYGRRRESEDEVGKVKLAGDPGDSGEKRL